MPCRDIVTQGARRRWLHRVCHIALGSGSRTKCAGWARSVSGGGTYESREGRLDNLAGFDGFREEIATRQTRGEHRLDIFPQVLHVVPLKQRVRGHLCDEAMAVVAEVV